MAQSDGGIGNVTPNAEPLLRKCFCLSVYTAGRSNQGASLHALSLSAYPPNCRFRLQNLLKHPNHFIA